MKRLYIFTLLLTAFFVGCTPNSQLTSNDFRVLSGLENNRLYLTGEKGSTKSFSVFANYDWSVIDIAGFTCDPSSGPASSTTTIVATSLQANNTGDTVYLSKLNFKLLKTRFVGLSAYQLPLIMAETRTVTLDAIEGSQATFTFKSRCNLEDIALKCSNTNFSASINTDSVMKDYTRYKVTVTALESNIAVTERLLGELEFEVDGVIQERLKIEIKQKASIVLDRSIVLLPGVNGGENMFTATSKYNLNIEYDSNLFSVTEHRNGEYIVKALADNKGTANVALGNIKISLADVPDNYLLLDVYQRRATASQTIMVKFVGVALSTYFNSNMKKMIEALNNNAQGDARIVAIIPTSTTDATMYELRYDNILGKAVKEKVKDLTLTTPFTSTLFENLVREMTSFAQAEKYAMVIGSHGHGWTPKSFTSAASARLRRMGVQEPSLLWQKPEGALTRHIGDTGYAVQYDIYEIANAMKANNIKLEYLLFDACFMSNVESAYELRDVTKYIIASPCEVMGAGFPYDKVMPYMLTNGGASFDLDKICSEYVNHYKTGAGVSVRSACVALTNTAELEALAAAVKRVNKAAISDSFSLNDVQVYDGISEKYNPVHTFLDLEDIVVKSCSDSEAVEAFKAQLDKCVTSRYHTDKFYSAYDSKLYTINAYCGITTSAFVELCSDTWRQTGWYLATH